MIERDDQVELVAINVGQLVAWPACGQLFDGQYLVLERALAFERAELAADGCQEVVGLLGIFQVVDARRSALDGQESAETLVELCRVLDLQLGNELEQMMLHDYIGQVKTFARVDH